MRSWTWIAVGLAAVGCSSEGGGGGATTMTSTAWPSGCPLAAPAEKAACPNADPPLGCTYGDSPTADCREAYRCTTSGWEKQTSECDGTPDACAAGVAEGVDCAASPRAACLGEAHTLCVCSACEGDSGAMCNGPDPTWRWACRGAPPAPCPADLPNDGTTCADEGAVCHYGYPCHERRGLGVTAVCESGAWVWQGRACKS